MTKRVHGLGIQKYSRWQNRNAIPTLFELRSPVIQEICRPKSADLHRFTVAHVRPSTKINAKRRLGALKKTGVSCIFYL